MSKEKLRLARLLDKINQDVMKHMGGLGAELSPYVDNERVDRLIEIISEHSACLTHQVAVLSALSDFELVQDNQPEEMPAVTRFEFIGKHGREIVKRGKFKISFQDDGMTLKVFEEDVDGNR